MDERQQLVEIKDLITLKQYDEARRRLKAMGQNPTAQKWLVKLDEIAPPPIPDPFANDVDPFANRVEDPFASFDKPAAPSGGQYAHLTEEQKFERVKQLLAVKQYGEARQILMTLPNNPSAQKLLGKLQAIAPDIPTASFGTPSALPDPFASPVRASSTPFTDPFGSPTTTTVPRTDPFGSPFGSTGDNPFATPPQDNPFASPPQNRGYEIVPIKPNESLQLLQSSPGRTLTPLGQPTKRSPQKKGSGRGTAIAVGAAAWFGRRLVYRLVGGAIALAVFGVMAVLGIDPDNLNLPVLSSKDKFENNDIVLEYSDHWETRNIANEDDCTYAIGTCLLFLRARSSPTAFMVQSLAIGGLSHQQVVNQLWLDYQTNGADVRQVGEARAFKLDGADAVQWDVTWTEPFLGYPMYGRLTYVPTVYSVIEIAAWSNSQVIFMGQEDDIQEIIDSIDIKQPATP